MTDAAIERELRERHAKLAAVEVSGMGPVNRHRHAARIDALEYEQEQRRARAAAPPPPPPPPTPEVPEIHLRRESHTKPTTPTPTPTPTRDPQHDPADPELIAQLRELLSRYTNGTIAAALWNAERAEWSTWRKEHAA
jgi:hypothetical protein